MTGIVQSSCTGEQVSAWLRGLLAVAWADGNFDDEEKALIATLLQDKSIDAPDLSFLKPIGADELAESLGRNSAIAENFLRTAVMVAIVDGIYSTYEDEILHKFCTALNLQTEALESLRLTLIEHQTDAQPQEQGFPVTSLTTQIDPTIPTGLSTPTSPSTETDSKLLQPVREWLDHLEVQDPQVAKFLCKMIPSQCPFERDIKLFGQKTVHIPPLCKLNPLYEQLVGLRFRALSYLADDCGEDVTQYFPGKTD